jgi:predicted nucleic acid-binding protein
MMRAHHGGPGTRTLPVAPSWSDSANHAKPHHDWADDVNLLEPRIADVSRIHGPRQMTDLYLLALAVHRGGRFVTFDASLSVSAIKGAEKKHVVAL